MSVRPGFTPPVWASTANYPAGADPWSATPTKVAPGSAYVAAGFGPGQPLPAQVMNWFLNSVTPWLSYQDTIEARTFSVAIQPAVTTHKLANFLQDNVILYDIDNRKYFAAGQDSTNSHVPKVYHSADGANWIDDGAPTPPLGVDHTAQICWGPGNGLFVFVEEGSGNQHYRRGLDGGWYNLSLTTSIKTYVARWFRGAWYCVGVSSGPHVAGYLWTPASNTGSSGAKTNLTLPGSTSVNLGSTLAPLLACSASILIIAAPLGTTPPTAQGHLWVTTDGATFTHVSGVFASTIIALVYNEGDALFYALCSETAVSSGLSNVYVSSDGITWTLAATPAVLFARSLAESSIDNSRAVGSAASHGGVVLATALTSTPDSDQIGGLAVGRNAGKDWDFIPSPVTLATGASLCITAVQALADGSFAVCREDDSGAGAVCYSLRV